MLRELPTKSGSRAPLITPAVCTRWHGYDVYSSDVHVDIAVEKDDITTWHHIK
jgi:hypothetical protein